MNAFTLSRMRSTRKPSLESSQSPFISMPRKYRFWVLALVYFELLVTACLVLFDQPSGTKVLVVVALIFSKIVTWAPLLWYRPNYGWFHPFIFGPLTSLSGTLVGLSTLTFGQLSVIERHTALPGYSSEELALLVVYGMVLGTIGKLAYYMGFFVGPRLTVPKITFSRPHELRQKVSRMVLATGVVFALYLQTQGGLIQYLLLLGGGRNNAVASGQLVGQWTLIVQLGALACLIWLALDRKTLRDPLFWGCAVLSLTMVFLLSGSRSGVIVFLVLGGIVWMLRERKVLLSIGVVTVFVALMLIGILGAFRASTQRGEINFGVLIEASPLQAFDRTRSELASRAVSGHALYPILARVPGQVDFLYGRSYLGIVGSFIPRALWRSKPRGPGVMAGIAFFGNNTGTPTGVVGEAYWNFHIPGVLLVFFLFGTFHRWVVRVFERYAHEPAMIVLYAFTLYTFNASTTVIVAWLHGTVSLLALLWIFGVISDLNWGRYQKPVLGMVVEGAHDGSTKL